MSKTIELLGISHNLYSLSILINCFCHLHLVDFGFSVFGKMLKFGLEPDVVTFATLINGLCIESKIDKAVEFFDDMVARGYQPNVRTFNVIAQNTFNVMIQRGVEPGVITYTSLIDGLCISDQFKEALALLKEMVGRNISPDVFTFNILIDTLCKKGLVSNAQDIIKIMIQRGVEPTFVTYNSLMDGYCLGNQIDKARKLFDLMVTNEIANIFSYNILINGYCLVPSGVTYSTLIKGMFQAERPQTALELFKNMSSHGQQPDIGNLDEALTLLKEMEESQLKPDLVTYCILINGMCKAGKINDAKELFSSLFENGSQPNVHIYSAIMKGLCQKGLIDEAYKIFRDMERGGWFLRHENLPKASELINEMVDKGFSADATTTELVVHLSRNDDLILRKLRDSFEATKCINVK
ncbi:hypothetical protein MANES_09G018580v8 [Manihot esculenta]|uniref:Uncharacterized protein n=1 Tax=Manihot esculenta TaxID=3983 RepID=A0ACB7H1R1_MANES|nr:hypothetical protein MANES_09G018580v8 [Manihot esculenta]